MENNVDLLKIKVEKAKAELPKDTLSAINAVDWQAAIIGMRQKRGFSFEQLGDLEIETELLLCGLVSPAEYPKELERRMGIPKAQVDDLINEMNELIFKRIREELIKNTERNKIFAKKEIPATKTSVGSSPRPVIDLTQLHTTEKEVLTSAGIEIVDKAMHPNAHEFKPINTPVSVPKNLELPELEAGKVVPPTPIANPVVKITPPIVNIPPAPVTIRPAVPVPPPMPPTATMHPILTQRLGGFFQHEVKETEHSLDGTITTTKPSIPIPQAPKSYPPKGDPYRLSPD